MIISDESKSQLYSNIRQYVWTPFYYKKQSKIYIKNVKFDVWSLMAWDYFGSNSEINESIDGILNFEKYFTLQRFHILLVVPDHEIFQVDRAPCYKLFVINKFLTNEYIDDLCCGHSSFH